jgi:hypothetical protein
LHEELRERIVGRGNSRCKALAEKRLLCSTNRKETSEQMRDKLTVVVSVFKKRMGEIR